MPPEDEDPTITPGEPTSGSYAEVRNWPGYFDAVSGSAPRETLVKGLELFEGGAGLEDGLDAIDLGCGEGRDTVELLARGWRVLAIDAEQVGIDRLVARAEPEWGARLTTLVAPFETLTLKPESADLLNASYTLPFCPPESFERLWREIVRSIRPGGRFAGQLFGDRHSWASLPDRSHHTRAEVDDLFDGFEIEHFEEFEEDNSDEPNPRYWHLFHIVARRC